MVSGRYLRPKAPETWTKSMPLAAVTSVNVTAGGSGWALGGEKLVT